MESFLKYIIDQSNLEPTWTVLRDLFMTEIPQWCLGQLFPARDFQLELDLKL